MAEEKVKALVEDLIKIREAINTLLAKICPKSLEQLKTSIPQECRDLLTYEQNQNYYILKPKAYLGSENFAKILHAVREFGGEYVSSGKDSHFRVLKGG